MKQSRSTNEWIFGGLMATQAGVILALEVYALVPVLLPLSNEFQLYPE